MASTVGSGKTHLGHFTFRGDFNLEEVLALELEYTGNDVAGKHFYLIVELHCLIVVGLACESDLVLRRSEFLL